MYNKAEDEKGNKPWIENVGQAIAVTPIQNTQQEKPRKRQHKRLCEATGQQAQLEETKTSKGSS